MNRVLSNKKAVFIFLLPALVLFLTIIIVPIFMSVTYSLTEWDGIGKKVFTGFDNYKELFLTNSDGFWRAVKNSLIFAAGSVFVQLPISLILALIKGGTFLRQRLFHSGSDFYRGDRTALDEDLQSAVRASEYGLKIHGLRTAYGELARRHKKGDLCRDRAGAVAIHRLPYAADVCLGALHLRGDF